MTHPQAEATADILVGTLMSITMALIENLAYPLLYGAAGAVGSIIIRIAYKKWFKKYFEK